MTEVPAGLPSSGDETEGGEYLFEKAYSLYRLHREDDATRVLGKMKANSEETGEEMDRGVLHLEAQLVRGTLTQRGIWLAQDATGSAGISAGFLPGRL